MIYGAPFLGMGGVNPYQAMYQQLQGMPMQGGLSPNQMLALQASRGGYGPNSPYLAAAQALQGAAAAYPQYTNMGPGVGGAGGFRGQLIDPHGTEPMHPWMQARMDQQIRDMYARGITPIGQGGQPIAMPNGSMGSPQPMNPSIGLSDLVRQWQQGQMNPIAARQGLAGLAGVPSMGPGIGASQPQFQRPAVGQWSSQGAMAPPQPFSPLRNEGYGNAAPAVTPAINQFTAQNQTRGMGGGMTMGRPTRVAATYGGSGGRARFI